MEQFGFTPVAPKTVSSPSLLGVFLDLYFGNLSLRDELLNADNLLNPHFSCLRHKVSSLYFHFLPQEEQGFLQKLSPEHPLLDMLVVRLETSLSSQCCSSS